MNNQHILQVADFIVRYVLAMGYHDYQYHYLIHHIFMYILSNGVGVWSIHGKIH